MPLTPKRGHQLFVRGGSTLSTLSYTFISNSNMKTENPQTKQNETNKQV